MDAMDMDTDTDTERGPHSPRSAATTTPRTQHTDNHTPAASSVFGVASPTEATTYSSVSASASASAPASAPASGPSSAGTSARPASDAPPKPSSRKRGLGIVTPNACNECRKKRAKCDGKQPCTRCRTIGAGECVYEVRVRQSKEHLREEIELLNRQKRNRDQVLAALARSDRPDLREDVLARLRGGQSVDAISEWLVTAPPPAMGGGPVWRSTGGSPTQPQSSSGGDPGYPRTGATPGASGPSYDSVRDSVSSSTSRPRPPPPYPSSGPWAMHGSSFSADVASGVMHLVGNDGEINRAEAPRFRGLAQVLSPEIPEMKVPASAWTKVTDDSRLVQHLLALYFCWEYPTFASLSKEHFLKDFQDGRTRYCSSILVNALLALGCRFSSHPATRAAPDDPTTSGDHFFKECVRQLREEGKHHNLTTIQALGIMSIREASCGRDSESWYYAGQSMRLTLEMGLQMTNGNGEEDDETAVRSATFWGAYSLDLAWCLATGSLPVCSLNPRLPAKPAIIDDIEASLWIPYTDSGTPVAQSCQQPSNVRSVYKCFCELSELVHRSLYILHSPGRPVTGHKLQNIYNDYIRWYDRVPDVLRLGTNFTPSVLFAHMYYHFAILLLFRPFIKLRIIDSLTLPRDVCLQAADAIQGLSRSYSKLYTLRRTPSFVPYFVLTSAIMHLTIGAESLKSGGHSASSGPQPPTRMGPHIARAISRGIADLTEMAPCHHFAEQALNILLHLAKRWNLEISVRESSGDDNDDDQHDDGGGNGGGGARDGGLKDLLAQHNRAMQPHTTHPGVRPSSESLNFFVPEVTAQDVMCVWGMAGAQPLAQSQSQPQPQSRSAQGPSTASSTTPQPGPARHREMRRPWEEDEEEEEQPAPVPVPPEGPDHPLFWPFPMQGRPLIPSGDKLREAGFEFL